MSSTSPYLDHQLSRPPPPAPPAPPLPPLPPPAPPLPPQRYGQRAATAIARLAHPFIYSSRPPSPQGHRDSEAGPSLFRHSIARSSSPLASKSTAHKTGIPIAALDISGDRTQAIVAGRDILKTIRIHDASCTEDFNLRSAISAYASTHNASRDAISAQHRDQLVAFDVKWSRGNFSSTIATAAINGRIVIYDVNRPSVEVARLHEHTRQVHRLAFNAYQGALLLSGSQDGTVRMWDMRDLRGERSVRVTGSIKRFFGNSDGIRDVRWSPTDGVEFASGTDSGAIQRWDFRKENAPVLKINAHEKTCRSIDWHPSGRYLASGGADKNIKVWDFKSTDRRMKPSWLFRAPQALLSIRWRPVDILPGEKDGELRQSTHIASSYDGKDPRIHIWDFRRPFVPFIELEKYDTPATDMLWHSEDLLWTVGSAGVFTQTDMNFSTKPIDRQNVNVMTTAPNGQFCYFSDSRPRRCFSLAEAEEHFLHRVNTNESSGDKLSGSHSATDGSLEEASVLSYSIKKSRQKIAYSQASNSGLTTSSQRYDTKGEDNVTLDPLYRSTQIASYGHVLGVFDAESFEYLARHYELPSLTPAVLHEHMLTKAFEGNANFAAHTGQYRLAQTWRILGRAAQKALRKRRETSQNANAIKPSRANGNITQHTSLFQGASLKANTDAKSEAAKRLKAAFPQIESSSNVPTPVAKPTQGLLSVPSSEENLLDHEPKDHSFSFNEPAWQLRNDPASGRAASSELSSRGQESSPKQRLRDIAENDLQSYSSSLGDFPDIERQMQERRSAMNNYKAKPRAVFRLDDPLDRTQSLSVAPRLDRHDSTESFQMFSASSDSEPRSLTLAESFGESQRSNISESVSENMSIGASQEYAYSSSIFQPLHQAGDVKIDEADLSDSQSSQLIPALGFELNEEYDMSTAFLSRAYSLVRRPSTAMVPKVDRTRTRSRKEQLEIQQPPQASHLDGIISESPVSERQLPWSLTSLLSPVLEHHLCTLSDPQFPSILTLFLAPYFPDAFGPIALQASYLLAYHSHLDTLRLYIEAASFRNACAAHLPGRIDTATQGPTAVGLWCENCGKPVKGNLDGWCARCCSEWGACPVCELQDPPPDSWLGPPGPSSFADYFERSEAASVVPHGTRLWAWCQGCGHGGHSSCLRAWWRNARSDLANGDNGDPNDTEADAHDEAELSEGACPTQGCAHDCVAGRQRELRLRQLERDKRRSRASVLRDDWAVGESRAVERTRGLVGGGAGGEGPRGGKGGTGRGGGDGGSGGRAIQTVSVIPEANFSPEEKPFGLTGKRHRPARRKDTLIPFHEAGKRARGGKTAGETAKGVEEGAGGGGKASGEAEEEKEEQEPGEEAEGEAEGVGEEEEGEEEEDEGEEGEIEEVQRRT